MSTLDEEERREYYRIDDMIALQIKPLSGPDAASKEVLLAQLCGLLMSPISRTAVVLGALAAKKGEGEAAAA